MHVGKRLRAHNAKGGSSRETNPHGKRIRKRAASGGGASINIVGCSITHTAMAIRANNVEAGSSREARPESQAHSNAGKRNRDRSGFARGYAVIVGRRRRPRTKNAPAKAGGTFLNTSRRRPTLPRLWDAVPSALRGLAAEFGMGSGVSPTVWPPEKITQPPPSLTSEQTLSRNKIKCGQASRPISTG